MRKNSVVEFRGREAGADPLTELLRAGARQLIHQTVEAELQELIEAHCDRHTADGKAGVVRDGYHPERELQTGMGPVVRKLPQLSDR